MAQAGPPVTGVVPVSPSQAIEKLVALLDTLDRWIDETPPVDQPSRFGNKAYRTWYAKLDQVRPSEPRLGWASGRTTVAPGGARSVFKVGQSSFQT